MGDDRPRNFTEKLFVQVICCAHLKFSRHGLFLAKKIKTNGSFIVRLNSFYHYLSEIETEKIVFKKQSSTTRASRNNNQNMFCFW